MPLLPYGEYKPVETNTSAQIASVAGSSTNNSLYIVTRGWFDSRGRNA